MVPPTMAIKWLTFALLLSALLGAEAQTITAASCNASDVQKAFNSVTSSTTTVNIPSGTCHWSTQVTLTVPSGSTTLSILGAGSLTTPGGGDVTNIVDDYASNNQLLTLVTAGASSFFRFAGITIKGGSGVVKWSGIIGIQGFSQNMRFDHNHLNTTTYSPLTNGQVIRTNGWVLGVMDHNTLDLNGTFNGIEIEHDAWNNHAFGNGAWADDTSLGSSQFLFIEDNTFNNTAPGGYANDCFNGGKFVWRYNTHNNTQLQTHPTVGAGGSAIRGCRAWEIYQNTFSGGDVSFNLFFLSSGTGVMWGNTAATGYAWGFSLHSMRKDNNDYKQTAPPKGWGNCGTAATGSGSNWDQNSNASTGYPCLDQPGQGKSDLLANDFPNVTNAATGCIWSSACAWPQQALEPVYEWTNNFTPQPGYGGSMYNNGYEPDVLVQNRDFYQYTGSFKGTSGTGSGLLSARPGTCTKGVAYWATDQAAQGTLYQCSSTNTWTVYYTPYTYPHPLQAQQELPPQNLKTKVH